MPHISSPNYDELFAMYEIDIIQDIRKILLSDLV